MKNLFIFLLPFALLTLVLTTGCQKDDDDGCTTDPAVTIEENIVGTWEIDGLSSETVTFNEDGTGSSSETAAYFRTVNDGKTYRNFDWAMSEFEESTVVLTWDYSPDTPVLPVLLTTDFEVLVNECDRIEMESGFGAEIELTR